MNRMNGIPGTSVLVPAFLLAGLPLLTGCQAEAGDPLGAADPAPQTAEASPAAAAGGHAAETGEAAVRAGLAELRRATASYHRVEAAKADGFVQLLPCLANPEGEGAIGIPFAKLDRFDATIDLSEPEILFYEPQESGRLRLVGGEPAVPIEAWPEGEPPPSLFGREFHRNEEHGLFGLHMWVWRHNPDGVFAFWHPDVTCEFAE